MVVGREEGKRDKGVERGGGGIRPPPASHFISSLPFLSINRPSRRRDTVHLPLDHTGDPRGHTPREVHDWDWRG